MTYEHTEGHTFSFYLSGGEGVSRVDLGRENHGWAGAVCVMPQGYSSTWQVKEPFEFLHVYVSDQELRRQFAQIFDKDARLLDVREQTFIPSGGLSSIFLNLQNAVASEDYINAQEAISTLICGAFTLNVMGELKTPALTGGLSLRNLKRVKDYVIANLDQNISLKDLADLVHLSEFHFQRNFKAQCGVSPHVWVTWLRVEQAKELMRKKESLAQISHACAFSSQSHFTRTFKKYTGMSPGVYMKEIKKI